MPAAVHLVTGCADCPFSVVDEEAWTQPLLCNAPAKRVEGPIDRALGVRVPAACPLRPEGLVLLLAGTSAAKAAKAAREREEAEAVDLDALLSAPVESEPDESPATGRGFTLDVQLCPLCGEAMVSRRNRATGESFYGCAAYPECTGTRDARGFDTSGGYRSEDPDDGDTSLLSDPFWQDD